MRFTESIDHRYLAAVFLVGLVFTGSLVLNEEIEGDSDEFQGLNQISSEAQYREIMSSQGQSTVGNPQESLESDSVDRSFSSGDSGSVDRVSETNIQVQGINEPDILKNGGDEIFYSPQTYGDGNTSVFSTVPAENFSEIEKIPENGELFLRNDSLIVLGDNITSLDRQDYSSNWREELDSSIETARMINDTIYIVARDYSNNCPVRPIESVSMPCGGLYYTDDADTTYTLIKMDASSGEVLESQGFAGDSSNTEVYMSENSIYLTYTEEASETDMLLDFIDDNPDSVDSDTLDRIEELKDYDISEASLRNELQSSLRDYFDSSGSEEAFQESLTDYVSDRKRTLSTTGIAKFSLDSLELESEGEVPGSVNDQFSMDEKDGEFRIATTVGDSWNFDVDPENDLYVLDSELEIKGEAQGMGLNETIHSTRFIDDRAYVVTFRRIDPFHVVDLSESENPEVVGELKLPGFSSYLHPLSENRILGVGEENNSVKAVVFDVTDDEPEVEDSMILDDYYSSISSSHHAFQIDEEKELFFIPGSSGGHFFNYSNGLEHVKEVNMTDVKRSAYVNDNFYVFNDYNASVVDTQNWETIKKIEFRDDRRFRPVPEPLPRPVE